MLVNFSIIFFSYQVAEYCKKINLLDTFTKKVVNVPSKHKYS